MSTFNEIEKKIEEAFKPYKLTVGELKKMLANESDDTVVNFILGNSTHLHPYEQSLRHYQYPPRHERCLS